MYGFCLLVFVYRIIEIEPYESGAIEMKHKRKRHQQNLNIAGFIAMNSYRHASLQNLSLAESNP